LTPTPTRPLLLLLHPTGRVTGPQQRTFPAASFACARSTVLLRYYPAPSSHIPRLTTEWHYLLFAHLNLATSIIMAEQLKLKYCRGCNTEAEEHRFDGYMQCNMCREKGLMRTRRKVTSSCGRTLLACSLKLHLRSLYHAEHTRPRLQQQPPVKKIQPIQQEGAKIQATQLGPKKQSPQQAPSSTAAEVKLKVAASQLPTLQPRPVLKAAQR
jgi:hypothetical protein